MSVKYTPVQWNTSKWVYDAVMLAGIALFLWLFISVAPGALNHEFPVNPPIANARAFGACAFVMLTVILCIGPLARLDRRFLPLLYNRRHFGVMTAAVAMTHAYFVLGWYFAFFRGAERWETVLFANTSYGQVLGFPFEALGIFALLCLLILAATSHDFWLKFLTPPVWKAIHFLIYPAYVAVVGHVALGAFQSRGNETMAAIFSAGALVVAGLHIAAAWKERRVDPHAAGTDWVKVGNASDIAEGRAIIARLPDGKRVAVFRHEGQLSAISNACAHQNGPLGEGRIIDCIVTCPWHGFQYDVRTGRSPAPFTEKVPTYRLRLEQDEVFVDPVPNAPGTPVEPVQATQEAMP
ncbi:Rieske 2Fe-2S domain-containing protein [Gymnodinialimonas hymeniacidonis]|uniref:Rieske 2Fe-2S domain-containing protein n=1 Tax=Gymnodinialimonas hymeniacidonis TaxID=3126508 RepID=UPI0034C5B676